MSKRYSWRQASHGNMFRVARGIKYGSFALAAIVTMVFPFNIVSSTFSAAIPLVYVWSSLLLVGSLVSLGGIVTKTWVGEYIGLWGVISCLALYSMGALADPVNFTGQRLALSLIFIGFSASSFARHQDVIFQKRVADYEQRVRSGKPGL